MSVVFGSCLAISVLVFIYMAQKNYNTVNVYFWTLEVLLPIILMGYWLKTRASTPEAAAFLFCFIYLDSTFFVTIILFSLMNALGISVPPWVKILAYGAAALQVALVCLCVHNDLYYRSITVIDTGMGYATKMVSGPLKSIHYVYLSALCVGLFSLLIISLRKKGTYSRRIVMIYLALMSTGLVLHFLEFVFSLNFSLLPYLYVAGDVLIAADYEYTHAHDISCLIAEYQNSASERGYVGIGLNGHFLSCNAKSLDFLPSLSSQRVDEKLSEDNPEGKQILEIIRAYETEGVAITRFPVGKMTCACEISRFSVSRSGKPRGYLLVLRDATEEQKTLDIITSYNQTLQSDVQAKTENILRIQQKIVLGLTNMIDNRDDNTGGHVRRTSDIIQIIVEEIIRQGQIPLTRQMAVDIVRAAPTHDLGKITIDSAILRKPSALTPEEYEIMKTHAAKSGEMVRILLEDVEEKHFVDVAFNVARYHHERWDGKGYPEGLSGTDIPLEARIMSVADVYDALVSRRSYKDPVSFDRAIRFMCESMGTQFDPGMKSVFLGCCDQLQDYYRQHL